jgi:hypothetical protein
MLCCHCVADDSPAGSQTRGLEAFFAALERLSVCLSPCGAPQPAQGQEAACCCAWLADHQLLRPFSSPCLRLLHKNSQGMGNVERRNVERLVVA